MINKGYDFLESSLRIRRKDELVENEEFILELGITIIKNKKQKFDKANIFYTFLIQPAKNFNYKVFVTLRGRLEFEGSNAKEKDRLLRYEAPLLYFELARLEFESLLYKAFKENAPTYEFNIFELLESEEKDGTLYLPEELFENYDWSPL